MKILVADDDASIRSMLRFIVESRGIEVLGEASDGKEAIEQSERLQPDLVLLDVSMPILGGFRAAQHLHKTMPSLGIIFVTQHRDNFYVKEAMNCGANGYVVKSAAASELPLALAAFETGQTFCSSLTS